MSEAKHTGGEWLTKPTASNGPQRAIYSEQGKTIAIVYDQDECTEANALLMAASPDLLDALMDMLDMFDQPDTRHFFNKQGDQAQYHAALRKANEAIRRTKP